jgi:hypothetical protein
MTEFRRELSVKRSNRRPGSTSALLFWGTMVALSCLFFVAVVQQAHAQGTVAQTEIKAVTGRVEVLRHGQSQWRTAMVGTMLAEGDEIRAWESSSAELQLPDTTNLLLAENSRLIVTKVDVDAQKRSRMGVFHLAVGKVRAAIAQSAIQLVQSRQSNFVITTPGGVAATRGTTFVVNYDPTTATTLVAVVQGRIIFIDCLTGNFLNIGANNYMTQTGTQPLTGVVPTSTLPADIQAALTASTNSVTKGQRAIASSPPDVCADFPRVVGLLSTVGLLTQVPQTTNTDPIPTTFTPGRDIQACASGVCPPQ